MLEEIVKIYKNFENWIILKEKINQIDRFPKFEEGQIWWCYLGENIGHEENGKGEKFLRPVIIAKKFNNRLFYGIPTSSVNKENKLYFEINTKGKKVSALMSQMRLIDASRLLYKQSRIPKDELKTLKEEFCTIFLSKN